MSKRMSAMALAFAMILTANLAVAADKKAASKDDTGKAPRLTLSEPVHDSGTVAKGDKINWSFEVRNTGTSDLEILAAKPVCGCTVADFDKVIKPGATGKVTAHVDTTNFSGAINKSVTLETNDPSAPTAQLTLTAIVKPYVEAWPKSAAAPAGFIRFNLLQGDAQSELVTLYSDETEPFEILKVDSPQDWIKVVPTKIENAADRIAVGQKDQNQYQLNVTVGGPDAHVGPIAEKIHILTNSKHQPDYWLSVSGVVRPTFRVEPTGINFGEVAPTDTAATRTITIRSNDLKTPESFAVTKAESGIAGVTAAFKPTDKKGEFEVTLQVAKDAKPGALDGTVTITTNDRIKPTITVPVKGMVKSAGTPSASK